MSKRQPPEEIYLQWYGDQSEPLEDPPYGTEITFHTHEVFDHDVRYVRADRFRAAVDELNRLLSCVSAEDDEIITDVLIRIGD